MMRAICVLALSMFAMAAQPVELSQQSPLQKMVALGKLDDLRWPDFSDFQHDVDRLYSKDGYSLAWSKDGSVKTQAIAIIAILKQAESKGLDPEDYDGSRWDARLTHPDLVRFDLALTVSLMRYASDLLIGKFNPGIYRSGFDVGREHYQLSEWIRARVLNAADVNSVLRELEPPFPGYQNTQLALQRYIALARQDSGEPLPAIAKLPIKPGADYAGVGRLTSLLKTLGDLPSAVPVPDKYEGLLVDAVKHFQSRHGLTPDGEIGKATLVQLNTPLSKRVHQLQLALERSRWLPREYTRPRIVVNIPEFELRAFNESDTSVLEMKVVVGHAYQRKTPVFTADMKFVIFRPYWNVPRSITREELLPKVAKDRDYLATNGYQVLVTNTEHVVTTGAVNDDTLAGLKSGKLWIRQVPGPKNSLGLIKFMFPNEHNVYLHDTPTTQLFLRSRRDFSHGCIRVEKPKQLAEWVLRDLPEWTPERMDEAMHGTKPLQVDLPKPIPVLIVYATAIIADNGDIKFFDDIYKFDAQLDELIAKGYPCCRWDPTSGGRAPRRHE